MLQATQLRPIPSEGLVTSPLPTVPDASWTNFVRLMGSPECATGKTDKGYLGLFLFSPARLAHFGAVTNVRRENGKLEGDFVPPLTEPDFLRSPALQYRAFARSCGEYASRLARWPAPLPEVDATRTTLSGLLAVAHRAGLKGLRRWLRSAEDRRLHPFTSAGFDLCNGLF